MSLLPPPLYVRFAWDSLQLSERSKLKLLNYFVLGVPSVPAALPRPSLAPGRREVLAGDPSRVSIAEECAEPFAGATECDESMFGGHRNGKRGWGAAGKVIVLGIFQRNGVARVFPIQGRGRGTIERLVVEHTRPCSLYYTDDWQAYAGLSVRGEHVVVRKERPTSRARPLERHRRLLELCQALALPLPRNTGKVLLSLLGRHLLPLQPSQRGFIPVDSQFVTADATYFMRR